MKLKYNIELNIDCQDERTLLPFDNEIMTRRIGGYIKEIFEIDNRIKDIKIEGVIEL